MRVLLPRCWWVGWAAAALVVAAPVFGQTVEVHVDGTTPGTLVNPVWSYFGYDEVNTTTSAQSQELLAAIAKMTGAPVRVRTHFLLNSTSGPAGLKWGATNAYTENPAGTPIYDWTVMDQIMDAITKTGARPYAEIAFMPQALTRSTGPYRNSAYDALDGGLFYPPKDDAWARWGGLIEAWAKHTKQRYPDAEQSWIWELWNEPNIGYWHGTAAEYHKLFDYTEQALHGVFPTSQLGGPETAGVGADFLRAFLTHCESGTNAATGQTGTRLDYVSFHAKGGVSITANHVRMDLGNQLAQHLEAFKIVAGSTNFKTAPIVIGEADPDGCAACSAPPANAYRTMAAYGVYEMAMMKHSLDLAKANGVKLQGVTTWAWMFENLAYFSNYRQLATNGIQLPVLNAFKMLGELRGKELPVTSTGALTADAIIANKVHGAPDINGMAALLDNHLRVVVWNYHDDLTTATPAQVTLKVKLPIDFADPRITQLRFDEERASSTAKWVALGKPAQPSPDQLGALRQASELVTLEPTQPATVTNGELTATFELPRSGAALFQIDRGPVADGGTGGGGAGGAAGGSDGQPTAGNASAGMPPAGAANMSGGGATANGGTAPAQAGAATTATAPETASGCGCRVGGQHPTGVLWGWIGLACLAIRRRRRNSV